MESRTEKPYIALLEMCQAEEATLFACYRQLRELVERLCREQMEDDTLQMTDLAARISFVASKVGLSYRMQNRLHTFRLHSNAVLNMREQPCRGKLLRDVGTVAWLIRTLTDVPVPAGLEPLLPQAEEETTTQVQLSGRIRRMRVCFQYADETFLYVLPVESISHELLKVRYHIAGTNDEFTETCRLLWPHAQLNLLDIQVRADGTLVPGFIVLEPDYLIDISSLAECYRDFGHHPANYLLARLQPSRNTIPLLIGNIANLFLDEWIHAEKDPEYIPCMKKAFRHYPLELAACRELYDRSKEQEFARDCKTHFEHIRDTVKDLFPRVGYALDREDAVLEPSYICEALGLQGRLDYMQRDMSAFIEMKSGKADEYSLPGKVEPKENHRVQMLLYQAVLQYSMGRDHREVRAYLLYTRYPLLYPARSSWALVRRAIDLRNRIVAGEYQVQRKSNVAYTALRLADIHPQVLNEKGMAGRFWEQYLAPSIRAVKEKMDALPQLEKNYLYAVYTFLVKELYTTKSGDTDRPGRRGVASLWLSTWAEKRESGEILYDLRIRENRTDDPACPCLTLSRQPMLPTEGVPEGLPNFRQGDAVVLYRRDDEDQNVTCQMIFKGTLESITTAEVSLRLRSVQQNRDVLPEAGRYAIEHDTMDGGFRGMFQGLSIYAQANPDRRKLLLGLREPEFDLSADASVCEAPDDFTRVVCKARAARDYFLLVGPPGTGKTSRALRQMVETFYQEDQAQILLLAYTNRAVDEICKSLDSIVPEISYIRIGNELSCDPAYRRHLLEHRLKDCATRAEVVHALGQCPIVVGTVASVSAKPDLFRVKSFEVAIIDEASQILEPQLLGILCARDEAGKNVVGKFILIGDHKQLPAVVLQSAAASEVECDGLKQLGISNFRESLFERLYRGLHRVGNYDSAVVRRACDMLSKQGRMHPEVASFANTYFYQGLLDSVGLPHQVEELPVHRIKEGAYASLLGRRVSFVPSVAEKIAMKTNHSEGQIVAGLAQEIYRLYEADGFDPDRTLGIITPYRSQIALIRRYLAETGIAALEGVWVDTVERFQGSERDVIIYSFCVNHAFQLDFLSSPMEENGQKIDRKLNVALTRARKQLFVTGVPELLRENPLYRELLRRLGE